MNDVRVRALTTAELQQGLDRDSGLHVLNVQTDKFFAGELIPGSRRVPLDAIGPGTPELAKDAEIVTYCGGLACSQSIEAATKLTELGERAPPPAAPPGTITVLLDEKGDAFSSTDLAKKLEHWRDRGTREARFVIGAADGHSASERASADLLISFGPATWPHLLVRAMLAEQLFRATSILANHPYHREG